MNAMQLNHTHNHIIRITSNIIFNTEIASIRNHEKYYYKITYQIFIKIMRVLPVID